MDFTFAISVISDFGYNGSFMCEKSTNAQISNMVIFSYSLLKTRRPGPSVCTWNPKIRVNQKFQPEGPSAYFRTVLPCEFRKF